MSVIDKFAVVGKRDGQVVRVRHTHKPWNSSITTGAEDVAAAYLAEALGDYGFSDPGWITQTHLPPPDDGWPMTLADEFAIREAKQLRGNHLIVYEQLHLGQVVLGAGFNIQIEESAREVVSSQSTAQHNVGLGSSYTALLRSIAADGGASFALRVAEAKRSIVDALEELADQNSGSVVSHKFGRTLVYRYAPQTQAPLAGRSADTISLLDPDRTPDTFKPGDHYLVIEVGAKLKLRNRGITGWELFFDLETSELLDAAGTDNYQSDAYGYVYETDPVRKGHDYSVVNPYNGIVNLDSLRDRVLLKDLSKNAADNKYILRGEHVEIVNADSTLDELAAPDAAIPSEPETSEFDYSATDAAGTPGIDVPAEKFAAVNAYYHLDTLYRLVIFEFEFTDYFRATFGPSGTVDDPPLPGQTGYRIKVDHRAEGYRAKHSGVPLENATDWFFFGLITSDPPIGRAADVATVIHEFGHSCLHNQTGDGSFSWAHGFGDALAVILLDPDSKADGIIEDSGMEIPTRYLRSPFMYFNDQNAGGPRRRHNVEGDATYSFREPPVNTDTTGSAILASILFRAYLANGGKRRIDTSGLNLTEAERDAAHGEGLSQRHYAAKYLAQRIVGSAGGCMSNQVPAASHLEFLDQLIAFDRCSTDPQGLAGGGFHKVLDWTFQDQGIARPVPNTSPVEYAWEAVQPDVDVYIDDGRGGIYEWQDNFWSSTDIWNRRQIDDGAGGDHEVPIVGQPNWMWVRVKNRGKHPATSVKVRAYHCQPSAGLVWPDAWDESPTGALPPPSGDTIPGSIAGQAEADPWVDVGPFQWTPTVAGHECLLAIASAEGDFANGILGDPANVDDANGGTDTVTGPIPHWRLVPFDNNIGQRNVAPVVLSEESSQSDSGQTAGAVINQLTRELLDRTFWITNPYPKDIQGTIEPELPAFLDRLGWKIRFKHPGSEKFKIAKNKSLKVVFELVMGNPFRYRHVPERADIVFRTYVDGYLIGGITYRIQRARRNRFTAYLHRLLGMINWRYRDL